MAKIKKYEKMGKSEKMAFKGIKKAEKRKKALVKLARGDLPAGIEIGDLMAAIKGYNHTIVVYKEYLRGCGFVVDEFPSLDLPSEKAAGANSADDEEV